MIELDMYNVQWRVGDNPWQIGEGLIEVPEPGQGGEPDMDKLPVPCMKHRDTRIRHAADTG